MKTIKFAGKSKRKGITPVIAIVLLLMMTVAAAGMAYVWIMSLQEGIAADTDKDLAALQSQKNARLSIEGVYNNTLVAPAGRVSFTLRNSGTYPYSATDVANIKVYVDGQALTTVCAAGTGTLAGQGTTCRVDTATAFPTVPGSDGAVKIEVKPPIGSGATYICAKTTSNSAKTC